MWGAFTDHPEPVWRHRPAGPALIHGDSRRIPEALGRIVPEPTHPRQTGTMKWLPRTSILRRLIRCFIYSLHESANSPPGRSQPCLALLCPGQVLRTRERIGVHAAFLCRRSSPEAEWINRHIRRNHTCAAEGVDNDAVRPELLLITQPRWGNRPLDGEVAEWSKALPC